MQILTIEDVFDDKKVQMQTSPMVFKQAEKVSKSEE